MKRTIYRTYKQEIDVTIDRVIHNLPTWIYPEGFGNTVKFGCPICNQEMRLNIGHGAYIGTCSVVELSSGEVLPIHTECFNTIEDPEYKVNHFNQVETFHHHK